MAERKQNFFEQFFHVLKAIPTGRKISFLVTIGIVVGGFVALLLWTNRPDYQVLFSNLETGDASRITETLKERRIPFQLKDGGRTVLIPDEMVYQSRLDLASEGIPRGQNIGFEVFDKMPFGTTEFVQKMRYQQALQGELARTIMQFDAIERARVHLVPTNDTLFAEPERPSTASVVLRLYPGKTLDRRELQGIVNLVACAVEGLKPGNVTVVDMAGGLLSGEEDEAGVMSRSQFEYQRKLEKSLEQRIQTMLEPVVGRNGVVARVSADVDFRQVDIVEEKFDADNPVIRSEQRQKETTAASRDLPAGSPDTKYQLYDNQVASSTSSGNNFEKENTVINYEISKINRRINSAAGDVKRLSAAVIVDGPYVREKGGDGNTAPTFSPRSRKEMKTFEDIVKKAIGFSEQRGDQVTVSNIPFGLQGEEGGIPEAGTPWVEYAKKGMKAFINILLVLLFFLFAMRPFKKWLNQAGEYVVTKELPMREESPRLTPSKSEEGLPMDTRGKVLELTRRDPSMTAEIIRGWIGEGN
ncbi:MAG: flagellar M-ring protein FliF [Deltaproteobacteria bacterium]|nr:flagellar M-ring protein FliF [Deltaproteobacteria bacterium]